MKNDTMRQLLVLSGITLALTLPATAERILFLDAAAPGADPDNQWDDQSPSGYHFANDPVNGAVYNAANLSYDFAFSNRMDGVGNESLFDFDTAFGDPFPDGNPVPFSIVAYIDQDWSSAAAGGFTLLSKTDETGDGQFTGWVFAGNQDFPTRFDFSMQAGNNVDRLFARTVNGFSSGQPGSPMLLVVTHNGGGVASLDVAWYVNGAQVSTIEVADLINDNVVNDSSLVLGNADISPEANDGWRGSLLFLEVHDTVLTPQEVATRWNGGAVLREGRPPPIVPANMVPVTGVPELSFGTCSQSVYFVQHTDNLVSPTWSTSSTLLGNGNEMLAYDTDGFDPARIYRLLISQQ